MKKAFVEAWLNQPFRVISKKVKNSATKMKNNIIMDSQCNNITYRSILKIFPRKPKIIVSTIEKDLFFKVFCKMG